ncbi:hypothetical protein D9M68_683200 [compost metagenome]
MVCEHHDPCEQHQVRHDYGNRDACFGRSAIGRCHLQMLAKCKGGNGGVRKNSQCSLPAKGGEHESAVPLPGRSDHQHRWGGVGSQGPTDRHVDEQHAQGEVFHCFGYLRSEDLWREHQCRNGHGRWLRDQRSQQRNGSQPEPCGRDRGRQRHRSGNDAHARHHGPKHWPRGGHHHHDENEEWLGVVARLRIG